MNYKIVTKNHDYDDYLRTWRNALNRLMWRTVTKLY